MVRIMNKHAQQEIIGFVLIILIVTIVGLVFLSFMLLKPQSQSSSVEISNLLESSMYYTTDCAVNYIPQYKEMQDLIKDCYNEKSGSDTSCLDGRKACEVLDSGLKKLISESLDVNEKAVNRAYNLSVYYENSGKTEHTNLILESDGKFENCKSIVGGSHIIAITGINSGTINTELTVCKN